MLTQRFCVCVRTRACVCAYNMKKNKCHYQKTVLYKKQINGKIKLFTK